MKLFIITDDLINIDHHICELEKDRSIIVYSDYYSVKTEFKSVPWSDYRHSYLSHDADSIVYVGMNKIRTAANRYDLVHKYVHRLAGFKDKITIDSSPFTGEPWRCWYHFGFMFGKWIGVDYSNVVETDWIKWFMREKPTSMIQGDLIKPFVCNVRSYKNPICSIIDLYDPSELDVEFYSEIKEFVFNKFDTPRLIISNILKSCNSHFGISISFDSYLEDWKISAPNLPIYRFIKEENERRKLIYNTIINEGLQQQ